MRAWIRRSGAARAEEIARPQLREALDTPGALVWVDIEDPGPEEIETLQREFDFSPLSLEDVAKQRLRPKVDEYPNYYFIVMYAPLAPAPPFGELCTTEIDLFVGRNYVVTLHTEPAPPIAEARMRWDRSRWRWTFGLRPPPPGRPRACWWTARTFPLRSAVPKRPWGPPR